MGEEGTEGTVHLLCLAASSGVPLFCRSCRGGAPARQQLPFSVIGSLNGVHMFGQNLEVQLSSARTEDTTVVWKSFHDSITLIVLSSEEGTSELRLERLLQMVFGAMVLLVGLEELTNIRNVERLKKELRASYCLIDSFLGDSELIGDLTQCVDCVVPPEGSVLQEALSGFAEAAGTAFGSLVVSGRVVAATESWWRLGTPEAVLLPWLVGSLPPQAARDYPVYLPHGSPTVPHRLLTLTLLPGLELCLLCGPRPSLSQLDPQNLLLSIVVASCVPSTPWSLPRTSHQSQGQQRTRWRKRPRGPRCQEPATWCLGRRSRAQAGGWWLCRWARGGCCCCCLSSVPPTRFGAWPPTLCRPSARSSDPYASATHADTAVSVSLFIRSQ
ncbi:protein fuzzy homolog isoform X2 [Mustela erminea]|uniref:protein fuzzy homolog isoform X2 n=1 Tax=Mustela erminea TaxID=36723 RepID=UPI001386D483|nr:protein fuzzy homolog isoform X2 [Mustela erminea]